jgi:hypothetical protein
MLGIIQPDHLATFAEGILGTRSAVGLPVRLEYTLLVFPPKTHG